VDGVVDRRKNNEGRTAFLTKKQQKELVNAILKKRLPDDGLWTAPKVARWIEEKSKKPITTVGAWKWIRRSGFTLQVPRPKNIQSATKKEEDQFKKNWLPNS
jgi:transposase